MLMSQELKKSIEEERNKNAAALGDKKAGVWYPVSDPPKSDLYGIAFCVSGKNGNTEYDHAVLLDECNCYEEGKFWPVGNISENIKVHAWMAVPDCDIE